MSFEVHRHKYTYIAGYHERETDTKMHNQINRGVKLNYSKFLDWSGKKGKIIINIRL